MSDWKDLFQGHILDRGEAYYFDGAVLELHKTDHGYHAVVEGTEDYEVDIEMEGGRVCEMYCSCPYAEDGNNCKHMAAVLFEIEEQNGEDILAEETCPDDQEQEVKELLYYVFECPQNNLVHIYKLKEICTDKEWEDYRKQILKNPKNYNILYPFMEKEGMYESMLECIRKETFIYNLDKYEKVLKEKFPDQVRDIYISYLRHEAERAGNRKRYRELMKYLKKIRRYPGGKEKASEIAENWRGMYYRRTAMMDEMRKAGF